MRINVLQHAPNEGLGTITEWAQLHHHDLYIYHPDQFGKLPTADQTDMLVILGGPMSVNDDISWINQERALIAEMLEADKPIFGACFGAQQIVKTLGYEVSSGPTKEVGWAPVALESDAIPDLSHTLNVLHWHQEMFEIPLEAELLYSDKAVPNQGFVMNHRVVGLQFHLEENEDSLRELVINSHEYLQDSIYDQTTTDVLTRPIANKNKENLFLILDYINETK